MSTSSNSNSNYRVYLSVRIAQTGEQVADITLYSDFASSAVAEKCIEECNEQDIINEDRHWVAIKYALIKMFIGELLFVWMKEEIK